MFCISYSKFYSKNILLNHITQNLLFFIYSFTAIFQQSNVTEIETDENMDDSEDFKASRRRFIEGEIADARRYDVMTGLSIKNNKIKSK